MITFYLFFFAEYFLEDIVDILNYQPVPEIKKSKNKDKDEESVILGMDQEENCNLIVSDDYSPDVKAKVAMISEKDVDFEIIEVFYFVMHLYFLKKIFN
jgi:ATP-dependent RNA helicase A